VNQKKDNAWREAQRRCRLTDDDIRKAKELGFQPKSLIKNIPSPSQQWKAPVNLWLRELYEAKIGSRRAQRTAPAPPAEPKPVIEFRDPAYPWADRADIPPLDYETEFDEDPFEHSSGPPSDDDIEEQNILMLRRQRLFRWAAQSVAIAMSELPEVQKVAAFGAVAQPLRMEVPRFSDFRRYRIEVLHECEDLDLAVWTRDMARLRELKSALSRGLSFVQDTPYGGVAHHQVDVHLFDTGSVGYRGRLCIFGQCPKPGKRECHVPGCGAQPFLQQFPKYRFNPMQFESEPKVILFDRAGEFLVHPPQTDVTPARFVRGPIEVDEDWEKDVPF